MMESNDTIQDIKYRVQYTDLELEAMSNAEELKSWKDNFQQLKIKYEELLEVHEETVKERDFYREKYINEALQYNYLKNDLDDLKERIYQLEITHKKR